MSTEQSGLFDLGLSDSHEPNESPITDVQIQSLRKAFSEAGIESMEDRKALIESCTIRPVQSIRDLYARDVRPILRRIDERKNYRGPAVGSAWDNREEDTWIDRL